MAWINNISDSVSRSYNQPSWAGTFGDVFNNALGAFVTLETAQAQAEASAWAQERTRTATTTATGEPVPYTTRQPLTAGIGGLSGPQVLLVGGVLVAAYFLMK